MQCISRIWTSLTRSFELSDDGFVLGLSKSLLLAQLPLPLSQHNACFISDSKIIISIHYSKSVTHSVTLLHAMFWFFIPDEILFFEIKSNIFFPFPKIGFNLFQCSVSFSIVNGFFFAAKKCLKVDGDVRINLNEWPFFQRLNVILKLTKRPINGHGYFFSALELKR